MFSDIPSSTLTLGSSLNASNIKEGDDVYFECAVQASPAPYKFTWRHNVSSINIYVDSINMQEICCDFFYLFRPIIFPPFIPIGTRAFP